MKALGLSSDAEVAQAFTVELSGGTEVDLNQAQETDSAFSFAALKLRVIGFASDGESAQLLGSAKAQALGLAAEDESAQPLTVFTPPRVSAHRKQHIQFTRIVDADRVLGGVVVLGQVGSVEFSSDAQVQLRGVVVFASDAKLLVNQGDAQHYLNGVAARSLLGSVAGEALAEHPLHGRSATLRSGRVAPSAEANARLRSRFATCGVAGELHPEGIRNPTDAELAVLAIQLSRRHK